MSSSRFAALILLLTALAPSATRAAWPAGGQFVCQPASTLGTQTTIFLDLPGGDFAVAFAGWTSPGVVVATPRPPLFGFGETVLLTAPDGSVIAIGSGATAMAQYWGSQRATASGDLTPFWPGLLE